MASVFIVTFTIAVTFFLVNSPCINGIDVESAKEGAACFEITKTVAVDGSWMEPVETLYYPLMSRYDLYNSALGLSGKSSKDLEEDEIYNKSCITSSGSEDGFINKGFDGREIYYKLKSLYGSEVYELSSDVDEGFKYATCYSMLTDNSTFAMAACCANDNQMTWGVTSTLKVLPEETVTQIYDFAESMGFKREYFTALSYESCGFSDPEPEPESSTSLNLSVNYFYLLLCFTFLVVYNNLFI